MDIRTHKIVNEKLAMYFSPLFIVVTRTIIQFGVLVNPTLMYTNLIPIEVIKYE